MSAEHTRLRRGLGGLALVLALGAPVPAAAEPAKAEPAKIAVSGFGLFKNRELRSALTLLLDDGGQRATLDAGFIEDASLVLNSDLVEEGFFEAAVKATWTDATGRQGEATLDAMLSQPLERPLEVTALRLEARPGVRAVVEAVEIEGLSAIPAKDAEAFFRPHAGLYTPAGLRAWSPARMRRGLDRLREALRARGHAEAKVEIAETKLDHATGAVRLRVRLNRPNSREASDPALWALRPVRWEPAGPPVAGCEPGGKRGPR